MQELEGGLGSYDAIKVWELELMMSLGMNEHEYTDNYTTKQRARMIAAVKLPKFIEMLEENRAYEKASKKA